VRNLLGHTDQPPTKIYTPVLNLSPRSVLPPRISVWSTASNPWLEKRGNPQEVEGRQDDAGRD
jgi:hypothetical protein